MSVQPQHRFPSDLNVLEAGGSLIALADLRGRARAVAVYLMRTGLQRTLVLQHSGIVLVDAAGAVRYRRAAALPTGSFDGTALQAAIDRI
jgi:hypothetical protein